MTKYTCANCRETFESDRSDAETNAEFTSVPEWDGEPREVVCDDCWQQIMVWAKRRGWPVLKGESRSDKT